jgi:hypothetical protein
MVSFIVGVKVEAALWPLNDKNHVRKIIYRIIVRKNFTLSDNKRLRLVIRGAVKEQSSDMRPRRKKKNRCSQPFAEFSPLTSE